MLKTGLFTVLKEQYYRYYKNIHMRKNIFRNVKTLARMALIFSLAYYIPMGLVFFAGRENKEPPAVFETGGMGGMPYLENSLSGTNAGNASGGTEPDLSGIPEPAEYSKPRILLFTSYKVRQGDTIGDIARNFGLNQDTLISLNGIKNTRLLQINQALKIPNQDGILYTVKNGDTLASIAEKYNTNVPALQTVNELFSETPKLNAGLFIPGARLEWVNLQEINGDLFLWPVLGHITSPYGYRASPFTKVRQFHSGLDIGAPLGTPIKAAMAGRVSAVAYDSSFGNYVVITHHSGYRTLYGHMSVVWVKAGAYVGTGQRIGDVGSTGLSTGPHLHFTVYKNGVTVNPRSLIK
jgi:murein DD-endopeptidase MepM/ murein hydrolase activator NlpD